VGHIYSYNGRNGVVLTYFNLVGLIDKLSQLKRETINSDAQEFAFSLFGLLMCVCKTLNNHIAANSLGSPNVDLILEQVVDYSWKSRDLQDHLRL